MNKLNNNSQAKQTPPSSRKKQKMMSTHSNNQHFQLFACCAIFLIFLSSAAVFSKLGTLLECKNSLDQDQARQNVGPDLGPNCLQRAAADDKICHQQVKSQHFFVLQKINGKK